MAKVEDFPTIETLFENEKVKIQINKFSEITITIPNKESAIKIIPYSNSIIEIVKLNDNNIFKESKWYGIDSVKYLKND